MVGLRQAHPVVQPASLLSFGGDTHQGVTSGSLPSWAGNHWPIDALMTSGPAVRSQWSPCWRGDV
jgi:hypothetical protein